MLSNMTSQLGVGSPPAITGVGQWWWSLDRWTLAAIVALMGCGALLIAAASPPVANRLNLDDFYFVKRHLVMIPPALAIIFGLSIFNPRGVRRIALAGFVLALSLTALTLVAGTEINGAKRWLYLAGVSMQPTELLKPTFVVVCAWMFSATRSGKGIPGNLIATTTFAGILVMLVNQPDIGMAFVVSSVWALQFFLAGLPMAWVLTLAVLAISGGVASYLTIPHVTDRIDRFFNPGGGDTFQVDQSLRAFGNGGLFGQGPGEGTVKMSIPDSHADFIFAVAGEELGFVACIIILALFAFIVFRGISRMLQESSLFVLLAGSGLVTLFGIQALVNMGSTLSLLPTKGMTLPFVSYGGSSLIGLSVTTGFILALTRRRAALGRRE